AARGDRIDEIVRVTLLPPWRRHAFWWQREPDYWVRLVRVSIHGPAAEPAVATLHYLGDGGLLRTFEAELLGQAWDPAPEEGMPGEAVLRLQVRNASPVPWPDEGVGAVQVSLQWVA